MKRVAVLILVCAAAASLSAQTKAQPKAPASAPKAAAAPKREQPVPFRPGEVLEFDIGWSTFVTAGTATVSVKESAVGYAESADGVTWLNSSEPVFRPADPSTSASLHAIAVSRVGSRYYLWYSVAPDWASGRHISTINLAESEDGLAWTDAGVVIRSIDGNISAPIVPAIAPTKNGLWLWFTARSRRRGRGDQGCVSEWSVMTRHTRGIARREAASRRALRHNTDVPVQSGGRKTALPDLDFIAEDVRAYLDTNGIKRNIWKGENLSEFSSRSAYAISLILREKEILVFSLLQWAAIALAYYLWVQILGWISEDVWESDSKIGSSPI